jgi:hypothetical protein
VVRNVRPQQRISVFAARVVFCESFADVRAHDCLLAALLVVVAGGERCLVKAGDGEILFFGLCGERHALVGSFERRHGAFDGSRGLAGDAGGCGLAGEWRYG